MCFLWGQEEKFTQPQLLAVLCLMRYEDWTFREAEVRLREHRELRRLLQPRSVPDYTTLDRFLKRLDEKKIDQALGKAARRPGTVWAIVAEPEWPWTPPGWRRERSAHSSCGACTHHTGQPFPGGTS
ncbi:MAG: hypothetical protein A3H27_03720 [Acidobacteria bacterium RIFCSPLOWO2_02_FULL_59_13]|nr:MAG: hypothetical protein A3H27_03720 [Acidobacteria bacterium RIFCSPLOWO2_02_FULL_59_13]